MAANDVRLGALPKRGDIGSTATAYAKAAFEAWNADAVTLSPYMGGDTIEPFLEYEDRGILILFAIL
mgnify:CR=1 FL=1